MDNLPKVLNWLPKLGWPIYALVLFAVLGWAGQSLLGSAWRLAQVSEFQRSVQAVAQLASSRSWASPWESDPAWQALEAQLNIDLVPLTDAVAEETTWLRDPTGCWRASVTVPLVGGAQVKAIRGTRTYDDNGIPAAWWITWITFCAAIYGTTWLINWRKQKVLLQEREELQIWQQSGGSLDQLSAAQIRSRQLLSIMGGMNEGVLAVDSAGRILLINQTLLEQLGLSRQEDYTSRPLLETIRVPAVVELVEHAMKTGSISEQMIEVGHAPRYLSLKVTPQTIGDSEAGVVVTATDVSSSQRSELARREFVTGASHELKTPLAAIRAYTETLQSMHADEPEVAQRFLQNILDQADRMDRLVSGMLQLARAESGALKLKVQRLDATLALKPCIEAAEGMARAKAVQFVARLPQERTLVLADRDALQTIASNLLSNAIRYTSTGGRVEVELKDPNPGGSGYGGEGEYVCLTVSDTGIGISQAEQGRIFERFYRVQKDRSVDSGGTGLGLAIVKQLVQVLEGRIELTSQSGRGTRFEIYLPAVVFTQSSSNVGG